MIEEEDELSLGNALSYEAPNGTKHIRPYESRLDIPGGSDMEQG